MKPVYQTILTAPGGNCWHACIASILEVPLEIVPEIQQGESESDADWWQRWQAWLFPYNLQMLGFPHVDRGRDTWRPKGYSILGTRPPGCSWLHAVVALDGEPVWNPFPGYGERVGNIGEWVDWTVFSLLDPSKPHRFPRRAS